MTTRMGTESIQGEKHEAEAALLDRYATGGVPDGVRIVLLQAATMASKRGSGNEGYVYNIW
jgi:hypothetical protein